MAQIDQLFQAALGLTEPWQVVRTDSDATARRLDLYLDVPRGARFPRTAGDSPPARSTTPSPRPGGTWTSSSTTPTCWMPSRGSGRALVLAGTADQCGSAEQHGKHGQDE